MVNKCLDCNRKISITNLRNLNCKVCKKVYDPKCVKYLPPICVKRSGNFRFKIIQNRNWVCEACFLAELPFYEISTSQIKDLIPRFVLPPPDVSNQKFVEENSENEIDDIIENNFFTSKTKYAHSKDISKLDFKDDSESYENFPIVSMNIRSIVNKDNFTKFQCFLENLSVRPMVIALNETWVNDLSKGPYSKLKGYKFVQNHRHTNLGGGVAFYIADHLHSTKIDSLCFMKEKVFESLFLNIDINGKDIVFGTIYRTPKANHTQFCENLEVALKESTKMNKKVILMGDILMGDIFIL